MVCLNTSIIMIHPLIEKEGDIAVATEILTHLTRMGDLLGSEDDETQGAVVCTLMHIGNDGTCTLVYIGNNGINMVYWYTVNIGILVCVPWSLNNALCTVLYT